MGARASRIAIREHRYWPAAMISASAAKNPADVAVIVSRRIRRADRRVAVHRGMKSHALAAGSPNQGFCQNAAYGCCVSNWFAGRTYDASRISSFGGVFSLSTPRDDTAKTSINPQHLYRSRRRPGGICRQPAGSGQADVPTTNINDTDAAYEWRGGIRPHSTAACRHIKQANPCGRWRGAAS